MRLIWGMPGTMAATIVFFMINHLSLENEKNSC
jgi:hypothetical protein